MVVDSGDSGRREYTLMTEGYTCLSGFGRSFGLVRFVVSLFSVEAV